MARKLGRHLESLLRRWTHLLWRKLHDTGTGLADDVVQGAAGPREFRTAPLWGVGQRLFFLHDGRARDLVTAIAAHASQGSEANGSVKLFDALGDRQKQDVLDFLRSL